jgi:hypothetical protein
MGGGQEELRGHQGAAAKYGIAIGRHIHNQGARIGMSFAVSLPIGNGFGRGGKQDSEEGDEEHDTASHQAFSW